MARKSSTDTIIALSRKIWQAAQERTLLWERSVLDWCRICMRVVSDEVQCRKDWWLQGGGGTASRISPEPLCDCYGERQTDRLGQAWISVDDNVCRHVRRRDSEYVGRRTLKVALPQEDQRWDPWKRTICCGDSKKKPSKAERRRRRRRRRLSQREMHHCHGSILIGLNWRHLWI